MISEGELQTLLGRLDVIAATGTTPGVGRWRRLYSRDEDQALDIVAGWMGAAGLEVRRDAAGNLIGRLPGSDPGAPVVATGSHIDSVKNGGRLDGVLGVLGALTAVEHLRQHRGVPRVPLEVVAFRGEEGSRFPGGFVGSLGWAGRLSGELGKRDEDGMSMAEAMQGSGCDPQRVDAARRRDLGAFVELHIEQGGILEQQGTAVGVVSGIVGIRWIDVRLRGQANHAGTTPMDLRRDTVLAAARMIDAATRIIEVSGSAAVVTCGKINCLPGGCNIVAGECNFTLDLRDVDPERFDALYEQIRRACQSLAADHQVEMAWDCPLQQPPVPCAPEIQAALRAAAQELGISQLSMASGAGHDAQIVAELCPVGMLFVPSAGGRSHCPEEDTSPHDIRAGVSVLANALARLAY